MLKKVVSLVLVAFFGFGLGANTCSEAMNAFEKWEKLKELNEFKKTSNILQNNLGNRPIAKDDQSNSKKQGEDGDNKCSAPGNSDDGGWFPDPKKEQEERLQECKDLYDMEKTAVRERRKK